MLDYSDLVAYPEDYSPGQPPTFAITITVDDFKASTRRDPEQCFIARALKRIPNVDAVIVAPTKVRIFWFGIWWTTLLPKNARAVLRQWDSEEAMVFTDLELIVGPWLPFGVRKKTHQGLKDGLGAVVNFRHSFRSAPDSKTSSGGSDYEGAHYND